MEMSEKILAYCCRYKGSWQKIAEAIRDEEKAEKTSCSYPYVTIVDEAYPKKLRQLRFPPWILFYAGKLALCEERSLGVVGSRKIGEYGKNCTRSICQAASARVIVSGMARGVDTEAHWAGIKGKTIGVLGCGLDVVYPRENRLLQETMAKKQLLISEYPPGTPPLRHHFPWRNRLIAALSDQLVIPQATIRSGTMITVTHALEMGKEIYCVPYRLCDPEGEGCNELISNGANILLHFDDLR